MDTLDEPLDVLKFSIAQQIYIKMRNNIELKGTLVSYDNHLNMIISKAEETSFQEGIKTKRKLDALYLRGDGIILISPLKKGITSL
ncbi:unnamed protein product (macronuclear) [Paramecium tetraurelia]|uniref:Sm domain-containing protein n=3 Tax=Paramecium TaxID=5884 RepID=A0DH27_PARTE|nr:uncharacterized protein GSPATT00016730001 [Paramecium tetraurelia]CAD8078473.1 unnamed protein product [Paramecium sonneborni]CAD8163672.1 unnamed protein product [Paramecium octaurelia]CAK82344.1 unnamed protein product [Paramecium tetraurelia]|eukprot:XP_001449741.1 hypothetical protein (macronuclear) [Paramecium tetraurelia strain d4-2]